MQTEIKPFNTLTLQELYDLLQLRAEVFIVEQNCVYQDIDGKDEKALHLIGTYEGKIVAYARIFDSGDYFENASIGRVVITQKQRDKKWGHQLIQAAIEAVASHFGTTKITISAQLYLKKFYETNGFVVVGTSYLEDDILHIKMVRD
jgi:ElaA protein